MKIKYLLLGSALVSSTLFTGGDIAPTPVVEEPVVEETSAWAFEFEPYMMMRSLMVSFWG